MNIGRLVCVGLSHETAPVALREQLSQWSLADMHCSPAVQTMQELTILSTCNRLEIYAHLAEMPTLPTTEPLVDLIVATHDLPRTAFEEHLYHLQGADVVNHLCRVATGLESLVMGEGQILGQVRSALQQGYTAKQVGPMLALLFRTAIDAGKRARTETKISTNAVSISSAAVALAAQQTGDLRQQQIAVIGLGEMGELALKGLAGRGAQQLTLLNRTLEKSERFAQLYGGQPRPLHEIAQTLTAADVVFTATGATQPLITVELLQMVMQLRAVQQNSRPLTLIDVAVPRNIDPSVATIENVRLYDVDDLRNAVDEALDARRKEIPHVEAIIAEALAAWQSELRLLRLRPVIVALRQQAEAKRQEVLARTLRYLARQQETVDETVVAHLDYLSRALVNHLLHEPTVTLKARATTSEGATYAALVAELFGLDVTIEADESAPSLSPLTANTIDETIDETADETEAVYNELFLDLGWEFLPADALPSDELTMAFEPYTYIHPFSPHSKLSIQEKRWSQEAAD